MAALKRGRAAELVELGLDPAYVHPRRTESVAASFWLARNARRLLPGVFLAAVLALWPAQAGAVLGGGGGNGAPGRQRAGGILALLQDTLVRHSGVCRSLLASDGRVDEHVVARTGLTGLEGASARVADSKD